MGAEERAAVRRKHIWIIPMSEWTDEELLFQLPIEVEHRRDNNSRRIHTEMDRRGIWPDSPASPRQGLSTEGEDR